MNARFLLCAESIAVDQRRNSLSLFHIIEELNIAAFPIAIPYMAVVAMFDRTLEEPSDPEGVELTIFLGNQEISRGAMRLNFQGHLSMKAIYEVGGLVLAGPGTLEVAVTLENRKLATWPITLKNIGQPVVQAELPLRTN